MVAAAIRRWVRHIPIPSVFSVLLTSGLALIVVGLALIAAERARALRPVEMEAAQLGFERRDGVAHAAPSTLKDGAYIRITRAKAQWSAAIGVNRVRMRSKDEIDVLRHNHHGASEYSALNISRYKLLTPLVLVPLVVPDTTAGSAPPATNGLQDCYTPLYLALSYAEFRARVCRSDPPGAARLVMPDSRRGMAIPPASEPITLDEMEACAADKVAAAQLVARLWGSAASSEPAPIPSGHAGSEVPAPESWLQLEVVTDFVADGLVSHAKPEGYFYEAVALSSAQNINLRPAEILAFYPDRRPPREQLLAAADLWPGLRAIYLGAAMFGLCGLWLADAALARARRNALRLIPQPQRECEIRQRLQRECPSADLVHVTLVHGTWARQTEWVRPGSKLRCELMEHLGVPVEFSAPEWSGWNQHFSRRAAARRLADALTQHGGEKGLKRPRFVIGHSHGGNVAMIAAQNVKDEHRPTGVVCLATPFLHIKEVGDSERRRLMTRAGSIAVIVLSLGLFAHLFGALDMPAHRASGLADWNSRQRTIQAQNTKGAALMAAAVFCTAVVCILGYRVLRLVCNEIERHIRPTRWDQLQPLPELRVIAVRNASDEATVVLSAVALANWAFDFLWDRIALLVESAARIGQSTRNAASWVCDRQWLAIPVLLVGPPAIIGFWLFLLLEGPSPAGLFLLALTSLPALALVVGYGPYALCAMMGLVLLPLKLISFVIMLPFGVDLALVSLRYQVAVDSCLLGDSCSFVHPPIGFGDADSSPTLAHLVCTDDPRVIASVAEWMRGQLPT